MDAPSSIIPSSSTSNPLEIFQQLSNLLFLQALAAGKNPMMQQQGMNLGMLGLFAPPPQKQFPSISSSSPTQVTTQLPPPISPCNNGMTEFQAISNILAAHQSLKNDFSTPPDSQLMKYSNKNYGGVSPIAPRQYKVHVNRESARPLQEWMRQHIHDPYPTNADVQKLSEETGFTFKQIRNWFTNSRRRYEQQYIDQPLPWQKKDAPKVCRQPSPPAMVKSESPEGNENV